MTGACCAAGGVTDNIAVGYDDRDGLLGKRLLKQPITQITPDKASAPIVILPATSKTAVPRDAVYSAISKIIPVSTKPETEGSVSQPTTCSGPRCRDFRLKQK